MASTDESEAFQGVEVAILIAGFPFKSGMKRSHIIEKNVEMYKRHGLALSEYASKKVKVRSSQLTRMRYCVSRSWLQRVQQIQMRSF